jgi:hypothetical protein
MNRNIIFFLLFGLSTIATFSCKKSDNNVNDDYTAYIPTTDKEWYYFKSGSFWIYKNDSTGHYDSLVVDSASIKLYDQNTIYPTEQLYVHYKSNAFNITFEKLWARSVCGAGCALNFNYQSQYYAFPGFICHSDTVGNVFKYFDQTQTLTMQRTIIAYYPSFSTDVGVIENVYKLEIKDFVLNKTFYLFIAKNMGIVKQQYLDSNEINSWTVAKMNIIQ